MDLVSSGGHFRPDISAVKVPNDGTPHALKERGHDRGDVRRQNHTVNGPTNVLLDGSLSQREIDLNPLSNPLIEHSLKAHLLDRSEVRQIWEPRDCVPHVRRELEEGRQRGERFLKPIAFPTHLLKDSLG